MSEQESPAVGSPLTDQNVGIVEALYRDWRDSLKPDHEYSADTDYHREQLVAALLNLWPKIYAKLSPKESPAGSALVGEIDDYLWRHKDEYPSHETELLQRARDRIVELESSGDVVEISTLLALKAQFEAQQERIAVLEAQLAQLRTPVRYDNGGINRINALEHALKEAQARAEKAEQDARRMDWLASHLHSADFEYPHADSRCVLMIEWPRHVGVGGSLRANVDAALASPSGKENK